MLMKFTVTLALFVFPYIVPPLSAVNFIQSAEPAYAQWSRLAIEQARLRYPDAEVIDYLYMGSHQEEMLTEETFRLWLREEKREYGMVVRVRYTTATGKFKEIKFQEIQPPS